MNSSVCSDAPHVPLASRLAWRILALACQHLNLSWHDLTTGTDWTAVRSRSVLCAVLTEAGYTLAQISQLVQQPYSVLAHTLLVLQRHPALAHEGNHLAALVVPVARGEGDLADLAGIHLAVMVEEITTALAAVLAPGECAAVRRYLRGTLFGGTRAAGPEAIWGIWVLARQQAARAVVDHVLVSWGLRAYCGLIDLQMERVGLA